MRPGMEIITADGKRIGTVGPIPRSGTLHVALTPHTIPCGWIARVDHDVLLRKTYSQVVDVWGTEPGPVVVAGGKR